MTLQEAFIAGIAAAKDAIKEDITDSPEGWNQANSEGRCGFIDEIEIEVPDFSLKLPTGTMTT